MQSIALINLPQICLGAVSLIATNESHGYGRFIQALSNVNKVVHVALLQLAVTESF